MKCTIEVSTSGRIARIVHENGRVVAEMLIHGPLAKVMEHCDGRAPILNGRANIFRGELWGLSGYEILNINEERIEEK